MQLSYWRSLRSRILLYDPWAHINYRLALWSFNTQLGFGSRDNWRPSMSFSVVWITPELLLVRNCHTILVNALKKWLSRKYHFMTYTLLSASRTSCPCSRNFRSRSDSIHVKGRSMKGRQKSLRGALLAAPYGMRPCLLLWLCCGRLSAVPYYSRVGIWQHRTTRSNQYSRGPRCRSTDPSRLRDMDELLLISGPTFSE